MNEEASAQFLKITVLKTTDHKDEQCLLASLGISVAEQVFQGLYLQGKHFTVRPFVGIHFFFSFSFLPPVLPPKKREESAPVLRRLRSARKQHEKQP